MAKCTFEHVLKIFHSSITPVLPENFIRKAINYNLATEQLKIFSYNYPLKNKNLYVVGAGKAVKNMALEVEKIFGTKIKSGIISIPVGSKNIDTSKTLLTYLEGAKNNLPDKEAEYASIQIKTLVTSLTENDFLLVLISGGGSALLPLPKKPITLEEKTKLTKKLAYAGADIKELNTVRKRISDMKGGQLARQAQPAQVATLILSDIVNDPLDLIASGPTVENEDPITAALDVIHKYNLYDELPVSIRQVLETDEDSPTFPHNKVHNYIIGSNKLSIESAKLQAKNLGYISLELSHTITGNVKHVAKEYLNMTTLFCDFMNKKIDFQSLKTGLDTINLPVTYDNAVQLDALNFNEGICLILGGETTVEVHGSGIGGRNQQLALEFSLLLHNNKCNLDADVFFLSAGTDGIDGPTDAAGAIAYINLVTDAKQQNLDVGTYLKNNDSYTFYKQFKNRELHVITGHTNTNVMDIHLILIKKQ
ncbi:glycerate kinase [Zerene cesonia]|uniref:glycerate kinase n=1 Tax=Zerene cesonia TaxID=33412 RepID=UPI0018E56147|nr:glycerate kinase [Zerene cesonia]